VSTILTVRLAPSARSIPALTVRNVANAQTPKGSANSASRVLCGHCVRRARRQSVQQQIVNFCPNPFYTNRIVVSYNWCESSVNEVRK